MPMPPLPASATIRYPPSSEPMASSVMGAVRDLIRPRRTKASVPQFVYKVSYSGGAGGRTDLRWNCVLQPTTSPRAATASELKAQIDAEREGFPFLVFRDGEGQHTIFALGDRGERLCVGREPPA